MLVNTKEDERGHKFVCFHPFFFAGDTLDCESSDDVWSSKANQTAGPKTSTSKSQPTRTKQITNNKNFPPRKNRRVFSSVESSDNSFDDGSDTAIAHMKQRDKLQKKEKKIRMQSSDSESSDSEQKKRHKKKKSKRSQESSDSGEKHKKHRKRTQKIKRRKSSDKDSSNRGRHKKKHKESESNQSSNSDSSDSDRIVQKKKHKQRNREREFMEMFLKQALSKDAQQARQAARQADLNEEHRRAMEVHRQQSDVLLRALGQGASMADVLTTLSPSAFPAGTSSRSNMESLEDDPIQRIEF